jgi:L-rhamnose-H+ transport protein
VAFAARIAGQTGGCLERSFMNELMLGLLIVIAASVLQGCFMVPMSYVRGWRWENSWTVFCLLGMVVFNWVMARASIPSIFSIYQSAPLRVLVLPAVFGLCWGLGAIGFGLGIAAVGFALGYAVIMGLVLSFGAFIPMVILQSDQILTPKGLTVLVGLVVMIVGIVVFGRAGIRKEKEQGQKVGQITRLSKLPTKVGLLICVAGGILSCLTNVGFALSRDLIVLAQAHGAARQWSGNAVWAILFTSGAVANLIYCGYLFARNGTLRDYGKGGFVRNLLLMALVSLMWIGSFVVYGVGAGKMGKWGTVVGWSVFIALSITVANLWGFLQGEWVNTSSRTRRLMAVGLGILVVAIFIFAYGNIR